MSLSKRKHKYGTVVPSCSNALARFVLVFGLESWVLKLALVAEGRSALQTQHPPAIADNGRLPTQRDWTVKARTAYTSMKHLVEFLLGVFHETSSSSLHVTDLPFEPCLWPLSMSLMGRDVPLAQVSSKSHREAQGEDNLIF